MPNVIQFLSGQVESPLSGEGCKSEDCRSVMLSTIEEENPAAMSHLTTQLRESKKLRKVVGPMGHLPSPLLMLQLRCDASDLPLARSLSPGY